MQVVIVGAGGQLGRELVRHLGAAAVGLSHAALDVRDRVAVGRAVARLQPQVVINCAADNRVDAAETDPTAAFAVNADGAAHVAAAAREHGAFAVHLSTDYVFRGDRPRSGPPYREDERPDPVGVYARSKFAGEQRVATEAPRHAIVRTAGLYAAGGARSKGGSFVDRVLARARAGERLRVVDDQITAPTWARDVAVALAHLLPRWADGSAPTGPYHLSNDGACSWYEFACAALELSHTSAPVEPIDSATLAQAAPRPRYSVLANDRLRRLGVPALRPWRAALAAYLAAP